ncbi:MAG: CBS domain-containing protein [Candidatus Thorarchaeota archaeon]|nr:CBS domain-containing protein [Candidatus Thorarchaeota archaeon]
MKVRDFMTEMLITADEDTPVVSAARLMAAEDIGSLVVTKSEAMVGIVTQRDIIGAQLLSDEVYHALTLKDIMTAPVVSVEPDSSLWQVVSLMDQTGKKHIPVVEGNVAIGVVSATDIIRVLATMHLIAEGADSED